ncbi:MAG: Rieske 2Fe-2S domain-containing protein [Actinomycetota bacterium]|nr:Rieske 2Fe-2S domain-containing protein [Actinomycetota bacterium]
MRLSRFTEWLESQPGVDRLGQPLNEAVHRVIRAGPVKDALSGTWLGHPLHPVLVMVPIGSWTSASIIDIAGGGRAATAARRLVGIGVLAALPAAVSGLTDWSDTAGAEQRVGFSHATLNSVALALYGASWWARRRQGPAGTVLALAGMAVATGAGYLGGHLIYAQGVGVDTNSFHSGPQEWETVAAVDDLPGKGGVAVTAAKSRLLLVLRGNRIHALENRCSHRGGPLSDGTVEGTCATCPWHGSRFDLESGEVMAGPAIVGQAVYETRVRDGEVEVRRHEERALRTSPDGPG